MHDSHPRRRARHHGRHDTGHDAGHDGGHAGWLRELVHDFRAGRPPVRRGDVRPAILAVLRDEPMHGYQVIRELEERSGGRWRPSAGSVYPTLQQLQDEGLVRSEEVDGRRTYTLTDAGREAAAAAPPATAWDADEADDSSNIHREAMQLARAAIQVAKVGSPAARREAHGLLVTARRDLYRILADDAPTEPGG